MKTAECTPIVLRETDRVRLVFRPTLVQNDDQAKACVRGDFVYQRKSSQEEWLPINSASLATVKAGEQYRLELHSSELLALMEELGPIYRARWAERGATFRRRTYVRMESSAVQFLNLGHEQLESFLNVHKQDAVTILLKLFKWLASASLTPDTIKELTEIDSGSLPAVTSFLGLAALKSALQFWRANTANSSEEFWQRGFSERSFVLAQLFAYPIVIIREKAYLGGKSLEGKGGSYLDFLTGTSVTGAVALVEIKTPCTRLLGSEYRTGVFPPSAELSGAIAQILKYKHTFATEFDRLGRVPGKELVLGQPRCIVIIGNVESELTSQDQRESFEAFRAQFSSIDIVGFDELFEKVRVSADLLERAFVE